METRDYRSSGMFEDGILKGLLLSFLIHLLILLPALGLTRPMHPVQADPPLCTVSLLSLEEAGGGEGAAGAMRRGSRKTVAAGIPGEPLNSAGSEEEEAETEDADTPRLTMESRESGPPLPVLAKIEKPVEKTKPNSKLPAGTQRKRQTMARAEPPRTATPQPEKETADTPGDTLSTDSPGIERKDPGGPGKSHSGEGQGAGSAAGSGSGGHGPYQAPFGSANGPRFASKVLPRYPRLAREFGKEGTVLLQVTIDEHGRLVDVEVIKRAGSGFDEEALRAVRNSTFHPARRNGRPVLCRAHLPILFQLKDSEDY